MSREKFDPSQSVSKIRRERSQRSSRRSGLLLFLFVALATAGAAWYWTQVFVPERDAELYEEETIRLISELNAKGNQLSGETTDEFLRAYEVEVRALAKRDGVDSSMVHPLIANVEAFKGRKTERGLEFEALLDAVKAFPSDSTREEIRLFDDRVSGAMTRLDRIQSGQLQHDWLERRKEVVSQLKNQSVGELTIRSDPSKADVYLDGELLAKTPFRAANVRTGSREIILKKEGYRDKRISVSIDESVSNDLGMQVLDPIVGGVRISVWGGKSRDKIEVEIEEKSEGVSVGGLQVVQGYQHFEGREHLLGALRVGDYTLIVSVNGKIAKESSFVVSEGESRQVLVEL